MLPVHLIAAAAGGGLVFTITIGTSGNSAGWDNSGTTFGSITPFAPEVGDTGSFFNTINTATLGSADFTIISDTAGLLQTDFTTVYVQDGTGTWRTYQSADATFNNSGLTLWAWGDGTDDVYDLADDGELSAVIFIT